MKPVMKSIGLVSAVVLATSTILTGGALAVTQTVTANIAFDAAVSITPVNDIDFGLVLAGTADTYTINTADVVTVGGPGQVLGGTQASGELTIVGSTTQLVDISVGGYTANNGVTPANATCSYDGGAAAACSLTAAAAPGAGKTLLLGVQAIVDGTQVAGTSAAPTFDVTVVYN